jgi:hypothetical protein
MLWRSSGQPDRIVANEPHRLNASWTGPVLRTGLTRGLHSFHAVTPSTGGARKVSTTTAISEATDHHPASPRPTVPFKSPTYPLRVHFAERAELEQRLHSIEERIQAARRKLDLLGSQPERAGLERLYFQMLGARDQVAEEVRRLPLETGELYDEDRERYEEALAAFERVYRRWESGGR